MNGLFCDWTANEGVFGTVEEPMENSAHGEELATPIFPPLLAPVMRKAGLEEPVILAEKSAVLEEVAPKSPEPIVRRASGLDVPIPTLPP